MRVYFVGFLFMMGPLFAPAQHYAPKSKYLVDSLLYDSLTSSDQLLLDSLLDRYHHASHDTTKLQAINTICEEMMDQSWHLYLSYLYEQCTRRLESPNRLAPKELYVYKDIMASVIGNQGYLYDERGYSLLALQKYEQGLALYKELGNELGIASAYNNIGMAYVNLGKIKEGLEYNHLSLQLAEKHKDSALISTALINIAYVYNAQGEQDEALKYYNRSLHIARLMKDLDTEAYALSNAAYVFEDQGNEEEAIAYFNQSLVIRERIGDLEGVGMSLHGLATVYAQQGDDARAMDYFNKALRVRESIEDNNGIAYSLTALAETYFRSGQSDQALDHAQRALAKAQEVGFPEILAVTADLLRRIYEQQQRWKEAYEMQLYSQKMKDSLYNMENKRATIRQQTQYEFEKQKALDEQDFAQKIALEHQEAEHQKELKYAALVAFLLVVAFLFYVFNRLRVTRHQKQIIEQSKGLIEEKNHLIESSIQYAQRIQQAVLPEKRLADVLPNAFLMYLPKDVVSGDFYWWEETDEYVLFTVADCTGHGVPGGFMSMLGSIFLNEIFNSKKIYDPARILNELNMLHAITLRNKYGETIQDGMDISFACLHKKTLTVQWAGANNPLWIVRKEAQEVEVIRGDRQPIGSSLQSKPFTLHTVQLQEGDWMYLFSDGFSDQFGGQPERKLGQKEFKHLIHSVAKYDAAEQKQRIEQFFADWKGNQDQLDDVCLMGVMATTKRPDK